MRTGILLALILICSISSQAQKNKRKAPSYYLFDKAGNACNEIKDAKFLGISEQVSDTAWQWKYYNFSGPLINVETYYDKEMTIPHGYFAYFDKNGTIDSTGLTYRGKKDGTWYYWTDTLSVWKTDEFEKGRLIRTTDEAGLKARRESQKAADTSTMEKVEIEAQFPGEERAWIKYLQKNIKFPTRAEQLGKNGTVMISFVVNTKGELVNINLARSVEYSLDEEAVRLIRESPKWNPAFQNNRNVNAYRRQPITFALQ